MASSIELAVDQGVQAVRGDVHDPVRLAVDEHLHRSVAAEDEVDLARVVTELQPRVLPGHDPLARTVQRPP